MLFINALVLSALIVAFALSARIHAQRNNSFGGPADLAHVARKLNNDHRRFSYVVCIAASIGIVQDLFHIVDQTWHMTGFNVALAAFVVWSLHQDSSFNPVEEYPTLFAREQNGDETTKKEGAV